MGPGGSAGAAARRWQPGPGTDTKERAQAPSARLPSPALGHAPSAPASANRRALRAAQPITAPAPRPSPPIFPALRSANGKARYSRRRERVCEVGGKSWGDALAAREASALANERTAARRLRPDWAVGLRGVWAWPGSAGEHVAAGWPRGGAGPGVPGAAPRCARHRAALRRLRGRGSA